MNQTYKCSYAYTPEMCRRALDFVFYKRIFATIGHIFLALICIVGTASGAYYLASGMTPPYHYSTYLFYALAPIAAEAAIYIGYRKKLKEELAYIGATVREMTVSVDEDSIKEISEGENNDEALLMDVERVYESEELFVVTVLGMRYFILKKDSFIEGDANSFASDMKQRVRELRKAAIEKGKKN